MSVTRTSRAAARNASLLARKSQPVTVHLRKMYVDCRYGQLHVHTAFPSSGGFDELTPLVCVHPGATSGRVFRPLLADLGTDRSVYAPDLPGHGESDAPDSPPSMTEYSAAVGDLLDTLRLRQVDVLGYQGGSLAAIELAIARPEQVRRVVLASVPVFDAKDREAFNSRPWPPRAREDGSHLAEEWQRIRRARGSHAVPSRMSEDLSSALRAGDSAVWGPSAAANYPAGERLPLLRQPTLVLRPHDEYWDMGARVDVLIRESRRLDLPDQDGGLLDVAAGDVARYLRDFLDR
ncbi:MAG TPA: alpha/beta fold hydrolase [Steroidobacteraceae bacterium]|nr:alpha/beta fold hydrolase [Steroidobacteraceae bacterium]